MHCRARRKCEAETIHLACESSDCVTNGRAIERSINEISVQLPEPMHMLCHNYSNPFASVWKHSTVNFMVCVSPVYIMNAKIKCCQETKKSVQPILSVPIETVILGSFYAASRSRLRICGAAKAAHPVIVFFASKTTASGNQRARRLFCMLALNTHNNVEFCYESATDSSISLESRNISTKKHTTKHTRNCFGVVISNLLFQSNFSFITSCFSWEQSYFGA